MKNKTILLIGFAVVVIAQLFIPAQMINTQEDTLATGKILKFRTAPIDPYDAFRGKYISLNFKDDKAVGTKETQKLGYGEDIFVTFTDSAGYALIKSVSAAKPETSEYIKAKVNYVDNVLINSKFIHARKGISHYVYFDYPFDRYYMNEDKAPKAERAYGLASRDLKNNVYAEVAIKDGVGVVKEVFIEGMPIKDYVEHKKL